jgi:CHAT domain-containing protein
MLDLGAVSELQHEYERARSLYVHALALARSAQDNFDESEALIKIGRFYALQKQYAQSLQAFDGALELKNSANDVTASAKIYFEIASVYQSLHKLPTAQKEIEKAIQIIESQRTKVSDYESRASYFASVHQYYELYVEVLMQLHEQHPEQNYVQQAFEAWERSKMRSLLDRLAGGNRNADCAQKANSPDSNPAKKVVVRAPQVNVDALCSSPAAFALTLDEIQQEIRGDNSLIVEYALGMKTGYVWVVNDQNISFCKIPNKMEISLFVERFQRGLLARQDRSRTGIAYLRWVRQADNAYLNDAQALGQILLGPVSHLLTKKRIIVVADGPLQHVPFSALPLPAFGGPNDLLRDQHEVIHLPSASTLKFIRDAMEHRPSSTMRAAVFADPVFGPEDPRVSSGKTIKRKLEYSWQLRGAVHDLQLGQERLPRLPGTASEAEAVTNIMGSDHVFVATGLKATREAVLNGNLGKYQHILFATHSLLDEEHPELSGLVFSLVNENGEKLDGYLRMKDIYQLKLSAELVVLSSCESALGKDMQSEGMIGLTRAFLYAGSKRVISSLWKVDDGATSELMKYLYQRIHQGENPGDALRNAQADLSKNSQWRHPYYWAGFVLQGEYRPIESQ